MLLVSGSGFLRAARTDVADDADPMTTRAFSGTLGGLPLASIAWQNDGAWSASLDPPLAGLAATVTVDAETSELSPITTP